MSLSRDVLRAEAKKIYKEQTKKIPKKQRIPFAQFFENYKKSKTIRPLEISEQAEDFDIGQVVNVNEVKEGE